MVREVHTVEHIVEVPSNFKPYEAAQLNDWIQQISEQNSEPVEVHDIQVESVFEAEEIEIN
jgi:hypothetical protein